MKKNNNIISFSDVKDKKDIEKEIFDIEIILDEVISPKKLLDIAVYLEYNVKLDESGESVSGYDPIGNSIIYNPMVNTQQLVELVDKLLLFYDYDDDREEYKKHYANCVCDENNIAVPDYGYYANSFREAVILASWALVISYEIIES